MFSPLPCDTNSFHRLDAVFCAGKKQSIHSCFVSTSCDITLIFLLSLLLVARGIYPISNDYILMPKINLNVEWKNQICSMYRCNKLKWLNKKSKNLGTRERETESDRANRNLIKNEKCLHTPKTTWQMSRKKEERSVFHMWNAHEC